MAGLPGTECLRRRVLGIKSAVRIDMMFQRLVERRYMYTGSNQAPLPAAYLL